MPHRLAKSIRTNGFLRRNVTSWNSTHGYKFWANSNELKKLSQKEVEGEEWRAFTGNRKFENVIENELEEIRDKYILDDLTCVFAHPNIHSFYFWGLMGMTVKFKNDYDSGHEIQPIFDKVKDLIHKEWKTKLKLITDKNGKIDFRGFCGEYSLKIKPEKGPSIGHRLSIDKTEDLNSSVVKTILQ